MTAPLILTPVEGIPIVKPGDAIVPLILNVLEQNRISILDGDIFVVTQKIVSKSENRFIDLNSVRPSDRARALSTVIEKDPRLVQLILDESVEILRTRAGTIIVEHKLGFVCANAGIDHSNVQPLSGKAEDWVLLLPEDPDRSACEIARGIRELTGKNIGVLIIDSHGRAWRNGISGTCIGTANVPVLVDMRGKPDLFGYNLRVTQIAAADELAAGASLIMGQAAERVPVVHVRGFPYPLQESRTKDVQRPRHLDLFR